MNAITGIRMKNPGHPGGFIKHEVIEPLELTVTAAAKALGDATGYAETRDVATLDTYRERLKAIRIINPACGSGAFLTMALKYPLTE